MKVLCVTDCQDRPETELFIRLSRLIDTFTVMSNPKGRNYHLLEAAGVNVIPLQLRSRYDRQGTAAIRAEVERGDYDIVHAFNSRAVASILRAARHHRAKLLGYRGVTTGVSYLKPESWNTFLSPRLDGIFCVAEAVRQALINTSFLWWRFPPEKARTIYKGHDPAWYQVEPVLPKEFGVPANSKTLCCVSRNSAKKGVVTLLDAFDRLPDELNCHLVLVGSVEANQAVRKRVARCRHPERVHFTGYRNDSVAIIRGADLLVSASESGEGLPRVVIEAMCVATPVVATDAGGTAELVINGKTGLLVPQRNPAALAEAIQQVFAEPAAAIERTVAARLNIESSFSIENTTAQVLAWYQDLLSQS
ncbi:MAG TPA: glycosyltransferase family 1 protein [Halothiobacillus sp.]|nr:glycosyltransferase family 1 protein [Halothiobacillus sp.]